MPHAVRHAQMGPFSAERPSIPIAFGLGTAGKMREPFLDSSESSDLVQDNNFLVQIDPTANTITTTTAAPAVVLGRTPLRPPFFLHPRPSRDACQMRSSRCQGTASALRGFSSASDSF